MGLTWVWVVAALAVAATGAQRGASLRGALEALQRRQRGQLGPLTPEYEELYELIPPQGYNEPDYAELSVDDETNPKYVIKLLDKNDRPPQTYEYNIVKRKSVRPENGESAFRERSHHVDNDRLKELFADEAAEEKKEAAKESNDAEYALLLGELWSKYRHNKIHSPAATQGVMKLYKEKNIKKRVPDNWGPIAFKRKRSSGSETEHTRPTELEEQRKDALENILTQESNYNSYDVPDDDKNDMQEEYDITFQPLEDDGIPETNERNAYDYSGNTFPISKRSNIQSSVNYQNKRSARNKNQLTKMNFRSSAGTDPRIAKDLSSLFGEPQEEYKIQVKRSTTDHEAHDVHPPKVTVDHNASHVNHIHHLDHETEMAVTHEHDEHSHEQHGHLHHPGMSAEHADHVSETVHNEDKPIAIKKKSIDWSDYFGIDKRKKKAMAFRDDANQERLRKQYFDTFSKEVIYPLSSLGMHGKSKRNTEQQHDESKRSKMSENNAKLENIDKKLRNMEGAIVEEALLYSDVEEKLDSKEEQEMKEKLLSRLAAAYSLEKMRKALKEFKQSLQLQKNEASVNSSPMPTEEAKAKRVAVKKEKVEIDVNDLAQYKNDKMDDFEEEQGAGHYLNGRTEDQLTDRSMGGSGRQRVPIMPTAVAAGACPVLQKIMERCGGVDLLAGDRGQLFLPLCSLHQICYLCGEAPLTSCDLAFLSEADTTCEGDTGCQRAARSALMTLRELHDNLADELDGECEASPCLAATIRLNPNWQRALRR